jgi:hypothetical protein
MTIHKYFFFLIFSMISAPGIAQFKEIPINLTPVILSSVAWADYDQDKDLDVLLMGWTGKERIAKIYRNDGAGKFTDIQAGLTGVNSIACNNMGWGDYDNDGDLDILITGQDGSERTCKIYQNEDGVFTENTWEDLDGVHGASIAWGDFDNDNDLDILFSGKNKANTHITWIYRNDNADFVKYDAGLIGVTDGCVAWADFDNDGDLDILLTGRDNAEKNFAVSKIYRNDAGKFTDINAALIPVSRSSIAWADYDNDEDLDFVLTGLSNDNQRIAQLYKNEKGVFSPVSSGFVGVSRSSVTWGDYNNDGRPDLFLTGFDKENKDIAKVYENLGNGSFKDIQADIVAVSAGASAWGDYDNDGDLDIMLTGQDNQDNYNTHLYENTLNKGKKPETPTNLKAVTAQNQVKLSWNKINAAGLTYNVRISRKAGGEDLLTSMAEAKTGFRYFPQEGNTSVLNTFTVKNLSKGTYYWSVQAINAAYIGSVFANEGIFTIE